MTNPSNSEVENVLPVQAYFNIDGSFNTFIGQGHPFVISATESIGVIDTLVNGTFYPTFSPVSSGQITSIDVTSTKLTWNPSTGVFSAPTFTGALNGTASNTANITGGTGSNLVYQITAGQTGFIANGTNGQFLRSNGSSAPSWQTVATSVTIVDDTTNTSTFYPLFYSATSGSTNTVETSSTKLQYIPSSGTLISTVFSGSGASLTNIPNSALTNSSFTLGSTSIALGSTTTTIAGLTSVTSTTFIGALTGNADTATLATNATNTAITDNTSSTATWYPTIVSNTTGNLPQTTSSTKLSFVPSTGTLSANIFSGAATNIYGGALNQIPYQTAANTTSFIAAPSSSGTALYWNGSAFSWTSIGGGVMVYPGAGIPNSTGSAWGTSYTTTGTGTIVALSVSPAFTGTITEAGYNVVSQKDIGSAPNQIPLNQYLGNMAYEDKAGVILTGDATVNTLTVGLGGGQVSTNTSVGYQSLNKNTTGNTNTSFGYQAGYSNTTGQSGAFFGNQAGYNSTGNSNCAFGNAALFTTSSGANNTAMGFGVMYNNGIGSNNTAIGYHALLSNTTGNNNTAYGRDAGYGNASANANTIGTNNTYIGYQTVGSANNNTNEMVIGYGAIGNGSNTTTIGNASTTNTYIPGTLNLTNALPVASGGTGVTTAPAINSVINGYTTTATAAGTTTLTNASTSYQVFTGSTTQTVVLPVTSTLATGWRYEIVNNSTGIVTVQSSGANAICTVQANTSAILTCIATTTTTAADWEFGFGNFGAITGTGSVVLNAGPTIVGILNFTGSTNNSANFATSQTTGNTSVCTAQTSGTFTLGNTAGTGLYILGQSTVSQTTNIQAGATASGSTKTIALGSGGLAGSTTAITIGSTAGTSTTTINGITKQQTYTVATLPSASTSGVGARSFVTDALAPTFGATVTGGGAVAVPVYSDSTNWKVG